MIDYPKSIDDSAIALLDAWKSKKWTPHSTRAAYHMLGFALSIAYPDTVYAGGSGGMQEACPLMSDDDFGALLEDLASGRTRGASIDWKSVVATLIPLLLKILAGL